MVRRASPGDTTTSIVFLLLSLIFVLLVSSLVWAGQAESNRQTSLSFTIADDKDQPVPEARVEIDLAGQQVASGASDAAGKVRLTVSGAGSYGLTVSKQGYLTTQSTLEVAPTGGTQEVDVTLPRAALSQQEIQVTGTPSNPVTETSSSQATLAPAQAREAPSKPATVADALPLIPGIVRAKDGSVQIAGYGEDHSALLVNSVDVTDPATGAFGLTVPIDSVRNISVSEMPYLAQYGRFTAGVVNAETRQGGDKWHFDLNDPLPEFRIRSAHLEGLRSATPRLNLSGPIVAGKLYFLEGTEYTLDKREVRTLPFPENQTTTTAINSFTQLDAILSAKQTLTFSFHVAPHSLDYTGLDFFNPQPVTPDSSYHPLTATITDRLALAGGLLQSTLAATRISAGIQPQGLADMILTPVGNQGNYFSQETRHATRIEWVENWAPRTLHFAGEHTLQLGSVVAHSENSGQFLARPVLIQDAAGHLLSRIDYSGGSAFAVSDTEPAIYAQDHWVVNPRFALDAGLRLEGQTITHTVRSAPRFGFTWTPDKSQKTVLRGGMGVFYDYVPLDVYAFSSYPMQTITTFNGLGTMVGGPVQYINLTQEAVQSSLPFIDRERMTGNFAPYSVAWNVELQRAISRQVMIRVKYLQSQAHDLLTIQPQLVENQNALVLGSNGFAHSRQLEFTARIGTESNRQFFFSYVRQYARGNINDASSYLGDLPFPVVHQNLFASLPGEIPNRFLLWGTYSLPRKFRVIPKLEYRNGFPYQPVDVFQQYISSVSGPQYRFPRYFALDVRVSKDIQVTAKHAVRLSLTFLNLTNHFNPLEVHSNVADPLYGTFFGNYNRKVLLDFDFLY